MPKAETVPGHLKFFITPILHLQAKMIDEDAFVDAISPARFSRYLAWANHDRAYALALYETNCAVSEALHTPLHMLEVVLRNQIHEIAGTLPIGDCRVTWFDRPEFQLRPRQPDQLAKARRELARDGKPDEPHRIVAALTFGFWTTLLGPEYETIWQQGLHKIAVKPNGKGLRRKEFSTSLLKIRFLRNRIAHHEPVIHWNLGHHHDEIVKLTRYLSPAAGHWTARHSRFGEIYPQEQIRLHHEA